jgi:hypothetical protein
VRGELLPGIQERHDAHDATCQSLRWYWWGRSGGVTALGDVSGCDDCDLMFWNEGVVFVDGGPAGDDLDLCACCARQRGIDVDVSPHVGLVVADPS